MTHLGPFKATRRWISIRRFDGLDGRLLASVSHASLQTRCGWPAFYEGLPGAIKELPDPDGRRIEIVCAACDGHMGHVFKGEGFPTPTDARHCVNGISLKYTPA